MLQHWLRACRKSLSRNSSGATLIEVVIAMVILGLITSTVPPVMILITKAEFKRNEQRVAESLTRNQMEYVKSASYIAANSTNPDPAYGEVPVPNESYKIEVIVQPIQVDPVTQAHQALPDGEDEGIQEVKTRIYHVDKLVLETRGYKVDR